MNRLIPLLACILLFSTGCVSKYDFTRTVDGVTSSLSIRTVRKFDDLQVSYNAETKSFELNATGVQTDTAALAAVIQALAVVRPE